MKNLQKPHGYGSQWCGYGMIVTVWGLRMIRYQLSGFYCSRDLRNNSNVVRTIIISEHVTSGQSAGAHAFPRCLFLCTPLSG